jgi:hypothetical protein
MDARFKILRYQALETEGRKNHRQMLVRAALVGQLSVVYT